PTWAGRRPRAPSRVAAPPTVTVSPQARAPAPRAAAERQAREATPTRSSTPTPSTTPTPRRPARAERLPTHRVREPGGHPGPDAVRSSPVRTPASALI